MAEQEMNVIMKAQTLLRAKENRRLWRDTIYRILKGQRKKKKKEKKFIQ